jgi:hypothetical protein
MVSATTALVLGLEYISTCTITTLEGTVTAGMGTTATDTTAGIIEGTGTAGMAITSASCCQ